MKQEFRDEVARLGVDTPPHLIRYIYKRLTLDSSADQHPAIDERVKLALLTDNYDLVLDLRHLNTGRPGNTFAVFFNTLNSMIDEWAAADERRHGVAHMAQFLSVQDMISEVRKRLPADTPVPSDATVELAFAPPNTTSATARYYTGRVNLKHQVQSRQLRNFHIDAHYCAALYKYLREMAVKYKEQAILLSCDDKAKVMVGEPNLPIASGVRGKRSICPTGMTLAALDHDVNQKGSVIPSVILDIALESMHQSFYNGQVVISLKDSIFEPSSPNRFAVEVLKYWFSLSEERRGKCKVLLIYTDGGPEHRSTFESVKIALIHIFRQTGVMLLVALRTAPGQSWQNPVERVMSVINIALQNMAIERPECEEEVERELSGCNTTEAIRKKEATVKEGWMQAINAVKQQLQDRIKRCCLKGVPFQLLPAATTEELNAVTVTMKTLDPSLEGEKLQSKHVKTKTEYQRFKENHCRERQYCFQVRKCSDPTCCKQESEDVDLSWLPDPVREEGDTKYKPFLEVYGTETTDADRPSVSCSVQRVTKEQQGCSASLLVGGNVRLTVRCNECRKPRCIFSKAELTTRQRNSVKRLISRYDYVCGSILTPEGHPLENTVFTRLGISCASPLEWSFYSSSCGSYDLCAYCAEPGATIDVEQKKLWKTVLPMCSQCDSKGKPALKRGPMPGTKRKLNQP